MLDDTLWSARVLADDPAAIEAAHAAFVGAGARVVITASYQVSREGFVAAGRTAESADEALRSSVRIARRAVGDSGALVAASVGPYGAILHDGSEYRGRYGVTHDHLVDFHAQRLDVLLDEQPDLLAIETIPDVDEVRAIVQALEEHPDASAWMTFSCADGRTVCAGQPIEEAVLAASISPAIQAVGVNCTSPAHVAELLARMAATTDLPLVVYPNAGASYAPETGWTGPRTAIDAGLVGDWLQVPTLALVGGCCGVGAGDIAVLAAQVTSPR